MGLQSAVLGAVIVIYAEVQIVLLLHPWNHYGLHNECMAIDGSLSSAPSSRQQAVPVACPTGCLMRLPISKHDSMIRCTASAQSCMACQLEEPGLQSTCDRRLQGLISSI